MTKVKSIGIIAEDKSDFESAKIILSRIIDKNLSYKMKVGHGCGRIKNKCLSWSDELYRQGCNLLILIHDLDENDLTSLQTEISAKLNACRIQNRIVCIPIQELEAWYLSDPEGLKEALNLSRTPNIRGNPENLGSPKERLGECVRVCSNNRKIYLNTKHNQLIAQKVSIQAMYDKCSSFRTLHDYITAQVY